MAVLICNNLFSCAHDWFNAQLEEVEIERDNRSTGKKKVKNIVLDSLFWRKVQYVRRLVDPIVEVLQKINGDESLSMPFIYNNICKDQLNACIVRLEPDSARRIYTSMQISYFGSAKADFGTDLAISARSELDLGYTIKTLGMKFYVEA
ncbi:uncharacterized protein Fot_28758 [Forsythia ovata]|uniref:Uncharacterized protein n=1 Tax=Forsythia ovata TaxID=205694 RepID=A0ABD1TQ05_9LAMI